jgi:hypothetical protein
VRAICEKYGLPYNTGPLSRQLASVARKIVKLALPTPARTREPGPRPTTVDGDTALAA